MKKYEVSWVEYHSLIVEADDEEKAQEIGDENPNGVSTCRNIGQEEVREVKLDDKGYIEECVK